MLCFCSRTCTLTAIIYDSLTTNLTRFIISATHLQNVSCSEALEFCNRCKKREALKRRRLRESDESDQCLASSCTIKDMIEQSSGSGSGLPLLVCVGFIMLTADVDVVRLFLSMSNFVTSHDRLEKTCCVYFKQSLYPFVMFE